MVKAKKGKKKGRKPRVPKVYFNPDARVSANYIAANGRYSLGQIKDAIYRGRTGKGRAYWNKADYVADCLAKKVSQCEKSANAYMDDTGRRLYPGRARKLAKAARLAAASAPKRARKPPVSTKNPQPAAANKPKVVLASGRSARQRKPVSYRY